MPLSIDDYPSYLLRSMQCPGAAVTARGVADT
jgi:hypothetical protein